MSNFEINGIGVDTKTMGQEFYRMICEKEQEALVAFGMLPADFMAMVEEKVKEKLIKIWTQTLGVTVPEAMPYLDENKLKDTVQAIMHEICVEIYHAASEAGKMCV